MSGGENEGAAFEVVLQEVGDNGYFQRRFNILFNFLLMIFVAMLNVNLFVAMFVPEHWCHVPGRENSSYTLEEWKHVTIPKKDEVIFSNCKMYNVTLNENKTEEDITDCRFGWEYNTTYYKLTAPSQENWVCDKELHVTNAFVFIRIGDLVGSFLFGQLGDMLGRVPTYYLTLTTLIVGRVMNAFTTSSVTLFMFSCFFGSLAVSAIFQAPLVIAMEISRPEDRAHIAMLQCLGWTIGFCTVPLVMWFVGKWVPFLLITTLPCILFFFMHGYLIESPRWLASRGKFADCLKQLKKIAKVNQVKVSDDLLFHVKKAPREKENVYGVMSIFSNWRLGLHASLLITEWTITYLVYYLLTLNINNLGGNPFINFFWQGFAELPGYLVGRYACDKIGRRWTHIGGFLVTMIGSVPLIFTISDPAYEIATTSCAVFVKFCISLSLYAVNLHSLEIYPTPLRQTGLSLGGVVANAVGTVGPYIVYLGTSVNPGYPFLITAVLALLGASCGLFLPETLHQKLPETLAEAQNFGMGQKIWSLPKISANSHGFQQVKTELTPT